jgi:hypothetical protein
VSASFLADVMTTIDSHFTPRPAAVPSAPAERRDTTDDGAKYRALFAEAMTGQGAFWPRGPGATMKRLADAPVWDGEQYLEVFSAVCRALRSPGTTPAERWAIVERAVRQEAHVYADIVTRVHP